MFNKRELRKVHIPAPENLDKLLKKYDIVFDFHTRTADHKRLLICDIYFKSGRWVRSFNHFTKTHNDFVNLSNGARWTNTMVSDLRPGKSFNFYPIIYGDYKSTTLNKESAIKYLSCRYSDDVINALNLAQLKVKNAEYQKQRRKINSFHNKVPTDFLSSRQLNWLEQKFKESGKKTLYPYFLTKVNGVLLIRHFKANYNARTKSLDYFEFLRETYNNKKMIRWEWRNYYIENGWYRGISFANIFRCRRGPLYIKNFPSEFKEVADKINFCRWDNFFMHVDRYRKQINLLLSSKLYGILREFVEHPSSHLNEANLSANNISDFLGLPEHLIEYLKSDDANYLLYCFLKKYNDKKVKIKENDINLYIELAKSLYSLDCFLNRYPQIELLIKAGYKNIVIDFINYPFFYKVNKDATTPYGFLGISKNLMKYLKNGNYGTVEFLKFCMEKKPKLIKQDFDILLKLSKRVGRNVIDFLKVCNKLKPSPHKILKYISGQEISHKDKAKKINCEKLSLYTDYIEMAEFNEYDLTDKRVYFPQYLMKAHDNAVSHKKIVKDEKEKKRYQEFYNEIKHLDNEIIGDYQFHLPKNINEFVEYGNILHQCVGRAGYFSKMSNRDSIIVFVNKYDDSEKTYKPYSTLEIGLGKSVQFRADKNSPPEEMAILASKHYLRLINKALIFKDDTITANKDVSHSITNDKTLHAIA